VHALAATVAAFTGDEWSALQAAGDWYQTGQLKGVFVDLPHAFELFVVEDTLGGIRSVQAAGEIFRQAGFDVAVHALGLTSGSAAKVDTFSQVGVPHYENWEALIVGVGL